MPPRPIPPPPRQGRTPSPADVQRVVEGLRSGAYDFSRTREGEEGEDVNKVQSGWLCARSVAGTWALCWCARSAREGWSAVLCGVPAQCAPPHTLEGCRTMRGRTCKMRCSTASQSGVQQLALWATPMGWANLAPGQRSSGSQQRATQPFFL